MVARDLWDVARISNAAFKAPWTFPRFLEQYETNRDFFLVAEDKGIVGFSVSDRSGLLMLVAVDPKYRGRGIGSKLLEETIKIFRKKGTKKVFAHVRESNGKVINFYMKHRFTKKEKLSHYYSDEDGWLLMRNL